MTRTSAETPTYRVQVLERAVDILQVLSEDSRELRRTPAYCSAVGKAMLAFLSEGAVDRVLSERPLRACTNKTLVTRAALLDDLRQTHTRGYSIDDEEIEKGLRCVGGPVWNYTGEVVAAISVAGPAFRITKSRVRAVARAVLATTRALSTELGYRPSA